ncbi:M3 family oligoendopeptidase [Shouchella miscanthi]|uniref:M3 family oligoendopeptidase n=1 Tax=Shouchella miscanthi TaxID=2598861 RepID=UPI0011A5BDAD|nr:M3 family oligoendopeptidase [Shouchella miscanthi]
MATFYKEPFSLEETDKLEARYNELLNIPLDSVEQVEVFLQKESDLSDELEEMMTGHYVEFNSYNDSKEAKRVFEHDQQVVLPIVKKYSALLDDAFLSSNVLAQLPEEQYGYLVKRRKSAQALFQEATIQLEVEEDQLATTYFEHTGSMTVDWNGEELTLPQLIAYYESVDRDQRKRAMTKLREAYIEKEEPLQEILSELIRLRQKKAENAGFTNFADYMFQKYDRFDYTPADCKRLAENVATYVKPVVEKIHKRHQQGLGLDSYLPWDRSAIKPGEEPLKPFDTTEELISKTEKVLNQLDPSFGQLLSQLNEGNTLDLESRKGKSPGGFCSSLPLSQLSVIFMNHAKQHKDMITLIHEMGHCIHNDRKKDLSLAAYRDTPMESSELASMSMELFTLPFWNVYYENHEEYERAKQKQLESIVTFLPIGMVIDSFQHWLYEHPNHSKEERNKKYQELLTKLQSNVVDWSGYEKWQETQWLSVLHIFEVPFYYIEYVIAQLGAMQLYKQYKEHPEETLKRYKAALALGSSTSLTDVYKAAGIAFDFSEDMIRSLMAFMEKELKL